MRGKTNKYLNVACYECLPVELNKLTYQFNTLIPPAAGDPVLIKDIPEEEKIYLHKCKNGHEIYLSSIFPVEL